MTEKSDAYEHSGRMAGFRSDPSGDPAAEHNETASGEATERNEIDPERRNEEKAYGPRTHKDTSFTRKSE